MPSAAVAWSRPTCSYTETIAVQVGCDGWRASSHHIPSYPTFVFISRYHLPPCETLRDVDKWTDGSVTTINVNLIARSNQPICECHCGLLVINMDHSIPR